MTDHGDRKLLVREPPQYTPALVRRVRERLDLSVSTFGAVLGVSEVTIRSWEAGQRNPDRVARRLLQIAEAAPELLLALAQLPV